MRILTTILLLFFTSISFSQNSGWQISELSNGNFKITNQDDVFNSWTAYLNSDGTYTYRNDLDPFQSFSEKINFDGSVTTVNDFNMLESFTTKYNAFSETFSITDDFDPFNSSTARTNVDGSVTITDDFDPFNSSTARTNVDGSVTITDDFPSTLNKISSGLSTQSRENSFDPSLDLNEGIRKLANPQNLYSAIPATDNTISDVLAETFANSDETIDWGAYIRESYANSKYSSNADYNPRKRKIFRKLKMNKLKEIKDIKFIPINDFESDPMYLNLKLYNAFSRLNMVDPNSNNQLTFSYSYRPDTGCGGVVIDNLNLTIMEKNGPFSNNILEVTFKQGILEGKCIDDVIYQMIERLNK
jgi:hypothetical protein